MRYKLLLAFIAVVCFAKPSVSQEVLSLDKCRELAKEHNQDVRNAIINVAIFESHLKSNKTNLLPKLDFSGSLTHLGNPQVTKMASFELPKVSLTEMSGVLFPGGTLFKAPENLYKLNLSLIQPIYMGGKLRNLNKFSQKQVDLQKRNFDWRNRIYYWILIRLIG